MKVLLQFGRNVQFVTEISYYKVQILRGHMKFEKSEKVSGGGVRL